MLNLIGYIMKKLFYSLLITFCLSNVTLLSQNNSFYYYSNDKIYFNNIISKQYVLLKSNITKDGLPDFKQLSYPASINNRPKNPDLYWQY